MGPTYLVLLVSGGAALVEYRGSDEVEARAAYDAAIVLHSGKGNAASAAASIVLTTIRAEAEIR